MNRSQSFHIITKGELTQKGDFSGYDIYNNYVFISNKIKSFNNVDDISDDSPLFCLAKVDEVFDKNINGRKLHFLKCYYAEFEFIKMLSIITDDIILELNDSQKQIENFMFIKLILDEYNFYKQKLLLSKNIGFNRNQDDEKYELPFLLLSSSCFKLKHKLEKYINYYAYDNVINEKDINSYLNFINSETILGLESKENNVYRIDLYPFFRNFKLIFKLLDKKAEEPVYKIITKSQLLKFDKFDKDYFNQFFELVNSKYDSKEDRLQYNLEHQLEFKERLISSFGTKYSYAITPMIPENKFYKNPNIEQIHKQLIDLVEHLESINIFNVIILPPFYTYMDAKQHIDYYLYPPEEDINNSYNGWDELADEEINRMDEETDGFWRF